MSNMSNSNNKSYSLQKSRMNNTNNSNKRISNRPEQYQEENEEEDDINEHQEQDQLEEINGIENELNNFKEQKNNENDYDNLDDLDDLYVDENQEQEEEQPEEEEDDQQQQKEEDNDEENQEQEEQQQSSTPQNQLEIVIQYHNSLSAAGKQKLLGCFLQCLHDTLQDEQMSRRKNMTTIQNKIDFHREEVNRLKSIVSIKQQQQQQQQQRLQSPTKNQIYGKSYENSLDPTQKTLVLFWKQMIHKFQPMKSQAGMKKMKAMMQILNSIFQRDNINYTFAQQFQRIEPQFLNLYEKITSCSLTPRELIKLHYMVHKFIKLSIRLAQYYQSRPEYQDLIRVIMLNPSQTNLAMKQIGEEDFREIALEIKPMTLEEKAQLGHYLQCIMQG